MDYLCVRDKQDRNVKMKGLSSIDGNDKADCDLKHIPRRRRRTLLFSYDLKFWLFSFQQITLWLEMFKTNFMKVICNIHLVLKEETILGKVLTLMPVENIVDT